ncbi:MAG: hypothetical protein ACLQGV_11540 [Bryobacteraceae bacterium]
MSIASERAKLAILRARTDRQLIGLIRSELERGLYLADTCAASDCQCDGQHREQVERAYTDALRLLPRIDGLSQAERRRIEAQLSQLQGTLDRLPVAGQPRARTAGA